MGDHNPPRLIDQHTSQYYTFFSKGEVMDINTLTFAFVIVALGIAGVTVYMKSK